MVGGVIDLFILMGPTPADVLAQYTELVGRPALPPLWALGFHQCRWGYRTANITRDVVVQYEQHALPLDTIWNDIDYMHHYNDFTFDPYRFPVADVAALDDWLGSRHQHHVYIVDPAIPVADYDVYHRGMQQNVFALQDTSTAPVRACFAVCARVCIIACRGQTCILLDDQYAS
jgi:alpha-glucosidase (family GH31 glycosyl hydrolase)